MVRFYSIPGFLACSGSCGTLDAAEGLYILTVVSYLCGGKCDKREVCRHGVAWLGLAGMSYLYPFNPPQGAVEDQIRMGSQIRISLIAECPRKMDGYGIEMGPGSLRDPPSS